MEALNLNKLLDRETESIKFKTTLNNFELNKHDLLIKKGFYIYGPPGTGKTTFVVNILTEMGYDIIKYDAGDVRNKTIIDTITKNNMSNTNIMSLFNKKIKRIAILMDEIDGMNNGDKGGINTLIKLIRPKKTKKQREEEITIIPIICIGNYYIDKKIKELMKVCTLIELKLPTTNQFNNIIDIILPSLDPPLKTNILNFLQFDLRKLKIIVDMYRNEDNILNENIIKNIFQTKSYNDDARQITQKLINSQYNIDQHLAVMNETDRTIVGLLWHENIIDVLSKTKKSVSLPLYLDILSNICYADYIDRITFQKQIWQFNEMSSLIKTFKNNKLYHDNIKKKIKFNPAEIRFTKVLTKYSTEYNNIVCIHNLCPQLNMDKKDLFSFFLHLKNKYEDDNEIALVLENYEITKLDVNRIYRYLDKFTNENVSESDEVNSDIDD